MPLTRNKLYTILFLACVAGYAWLFFSKPGARGGAELCPVKHTVGIPCPSCGATRAVRSLLEGDVSAALYINPFGLVITVIMFLAPLWILYDLAAGRSTLFGFYRRIEDRLRKPYIAIPLVLLVLANWIWNIIKGL